MRSIAVGAPGPDYRLSQVQSPRPVAGPGQMLVRVAAAGLNRADLLQAAGHYPPPPGASQTLGLEISGTVEALGDGVQAFAPGDRICALLTGGGYAEFALASPLCALPLPPDLDLIAAAALPEALFTVWTNIMQTGRLQPRESVLVHGGTSGIGSMAVQLLAALGHAVFATAGTAEKCRACLALGAVRAIDYTKEDFVAAVRDATAGRGADVVLDMVGGDYIARNMAVAAPWGRIVNIAYQKGSRAQVDFAPMLAKKLTLAATTLRGRPDTDKAVIRDALLREAWPLIAQSRVRPLVQTALPLARAQEAHALMAKGGHIGKILLVP